MNLGLEGKVALVTGGSHGIGRSIALVLAEEGCHVAICARNSPRTGYEGGLESTVAKIREMGGQSIGVRADVMILADIERVMDAVIHEWGTLHILVNNAGGGGRWGNPVIEDTDDQVWLDIYNKNALATMRFTMRAIPYMRKQQWGRVVTITSFHAREGGGRPWFGMAKAAQTSLMKNLALTHSLTRDGITFNTVAPGSIMIPDTGWELEKNRDPQGYKEMMDRQYPLGRLGTPEEVANVVAFVCSPRASLITGTAIAVDGAESKAF